MHFTVSLLRSTVIGALGFWMMAAAGAREPDAVIPLWSGTPPGETRAQGPEHRVEGRPRPFYQLTDVTTPSVSVFLPPGSQRNGTAVLVCPGGGLQRLAYEHEVLEVAEWLNSLGIAAGVVKYRVPSPALTAAMDAQRALALLRSRAAEWKLDPEGIGVLGFSAGGEIGMWLAAHADQRLYPAGDAAEGTPRGPDFVALIYPGGLLRPDGSVKEPIAGRIRPGLAPMFLAHAFDDSAGETLALALALKRAGVPTEVHVYRDGGHGFGVRPTGSPTGRWKDRWVEWIDALGWMDPAPLREYARRLGAAQDHREPPPRFTDLMPEASLADAYRAQRRWVRSRSSQDSIAGFKVAAAAASAQASFGIQGPLGGVLFQSGRIDGTQPVTVPLEEGRPMVVETEIGYITAVELSGEIPTDAQVRSAMASVVPVIELPVSLASPGPADARNMVAANVGSRRFIVGAPVPAARVEPDAIQVTLEHDGRRINDATGSLVAGGQWRNLRLALNALTRAGYVIPAGSVVFSGALGKISPGQPGHYTAEFSGLGRVVFDVR